MNLDVLLYMSYFIDDKTLVDYVSVCKSVRELASKKIFWKTHIDKYFNLPDNINYNGVCKWMKLLHKTISFDRKINLFLFKGKRQKLHINILISDIKHVVKKYERKCNMYFRTYVRPLSDTTKSTRIYKIVIIAERSDCILKLYLKNEDNVKTGTAGVDIEMSNLKPIMYDILLLCL